jgi:hypothetical protein
MHRRSFPQKPIWCQGEEETMLQFLKRRGFFLATLAASFGIPYALFDPQARTQLESVRKSLPAPPDLSSLAPWSSSSAKPTAEENSPSSAAPIRPTMVTTTMAPDGSSVPGISPGSAGANSGTTGPHTVTLPDTLEGPSVQDFGDVLRFDVNTRWITSRWSRVTTVLSEYELEGLRVPFVSGTRLDDIAGSLTYYYDHRSRLQRITFEGLTGDERRLAAFLQQAFGMQPEPSLYAGFYTSRWNAQLKSALIVRHAPVVRSEAPYRQFEIFLEINRPDDYYQLSEPVRKELERGLYSSRWGL